MSLPKQCLYTNKINSSYAKNYNAAIAPVNGTSYGLGETIIINIPTGFNTVMSAKDSILKFNLNLRTAGTLPSANAFLNRCGAFGAIQRLRIFHGSVLLSDIDNYACLMEMFLNGQLSTDIMGGKMEILAGTSSFCGANLLTNADVPNRPTLDAINTDYTFPYAIPLMSILSLSNNYVPLFAMNGSPLRIEIQLIASINMLLVCNNNYPTAPLATGRSFCDQVEYVANMMELSDSGMAMVKSAIGDSPVNWVVQDYRNYAFNSTLRTSETTLSVPVPAKFNSLNSLFMTFRVQANTSGVATFSTTESCRFGLIDYFFRIGSRTVPAKPPATIPEFFSEFLRAIGSVGDINHECNIRLSQYAQNVPVANDTLGTGSFYLGIDLESYSSTPLDTVYSGLNTSTDDIFVNLKFGAQTADTNVRIDTYALYDVLITIENGQCQTFY